MNAEDSAATALPFPSRILTSNVTGASTLYSVAQIRTVEQAVGRRHPHIDLMARAGTAVADWLGNRILPGKGVLCCAGAGNNGGDAAVAAMLLHQRGTPVVFWLFADPSTLAGPARAAYQALVTAGVIVTTVAVGGSLPALPAAVGWIVDGLFGIGLDRALDARWCATIDQLNALALETRRPMLAIDVPSGLNADHGTAQTAIVATTTLTMLGNKTGLHTGDGRYFSGAVEVSDLGAFALDGITAPAPIARLSGDDATPIVLPQRSHRSHKGSSGGLAIVGGASGMTGAAILAGRAALKSGAGRVWCALLADPAPPFDPLQPELMLRPAAALSEGAQATVVGPGLGRSEQAQTLVAALLASPQPLVIDADALNLIAASDKLQQALAQRSMPSVLTPHPLEAARLLQTTADAVQRDRIGNAQGLARQFNAVVVLKGSGTVIAEPGRETPVAINPSGNGALASAGTGDVLAGVIGALLAQGLTPTDAARTGVWLHGAAADALVAAGTGPVGVTASELSDQIRRLINCDG